MRVIAGTARGRRLTAPRGSRTRPTSDRVREAVFSSLQPRLPDAKVLDLFAGSGAMAIEALSRGAASAVLVEDSRPALTAIDANLDTTGLAPRATVVAASLPGAMTRLVGPFDVAFLDPPYDLDRDVLADVLARLGPLLAPGAVVRLEQSNRAGTPPWPDTLLPGRNRRYGDTAIHEATVAGDDRGR
jgi:16S rRNA (guanine966-N2)-methyltransferase